jgi:hypothetical protein
MAHSIVVDPDHIALVVDNCLADVAEADADMMMLAALPNTAVWLEEPTAGAAAAGIADTEHTAAVVHIVAGFGLEWGCSEWEKVDTAQAWRTVE